MPVFVAFLRAVNVGKRRYPMAELRAALTEAGFEDVATHIQTGNVRFRTRMRSREKVVARLEEVMQADRGFVVRVVLMTPEELTATHEEAVRFAGGRELLGHHLTLLASPPTAEATATLEARSTEGEEVRVGERAVHLLLPSTRYSDSSVGNDVVEKLLGTATTRSLTVVRALAEKWGD